MSEPKLHGVSRFLIPSLTMAGICNDSSFPGLKGWKILDSELPKIKMESRKHEAWQTTWFMDLSSSVKVVQSFELRFMMIHVNCTTTNYGSTEFWFVFHRNNVSRSLGSDEIWCLAGACLLVFWSGCNIWIKMGKGKLYENFRWIPGTKENHENTKGVTTRKIYKHLIKHGKIQSGAWSNQALVTVK